MYRAFPAGVEGDRGSGTGYKRQGYRVAVAASRRRAAGDAEECEKGLLWRTACTNIDGRYVLSWAANPPVALSTDLLPLVFDCRYRIR